MSSLAVCHRSHIASSVPLVIDGIKAGVGVVLYSLGCLQSVLPKVRDVHVWHQCCSCDALRSRMRLAAKDKT